GGALTALQGSSLRSLDLNETPLNADYLQHLSSMKTLFRLGVRGVPLNDQQAEFIRQTPAVMELDLRDTGLTDFGVTRIATPQCPVMELDVRHLSPDLVNSIASREDNCTFHVDKQTVEPDLMRRILQMECEVEFQQCEFTSEAIELIEQQHAAAHRLSVKEPLNTPDSVLQRMRRLYLLDN
ncbi:MAG: hypothetical protein KDA87_18490, partial [Planctomycetales bacterium]|nr:hypothetical protein [Planctomycetales bacterium]